MNKPRPNDGRLEIKEWKSYGHRRVGTANFKVLESQMILSSVKERGSISCDLYHSQRLLKHTMYIRIR